MKLEEFNTLLLKNPNEAKNFISFLIGHFYKKDQNTGKAIISIYKNLPENLKIDKKVYIPVMHKYFTSYLIDDNNKDIFREYLPLFRSAQAEEIKMLNKDNDYEFEKVEYKNSLEFVKSLVLNKYDYNNKSYEKAVNFLENNESIITDLIKKNKKSFFNNMVKYKVFENLVCYEAVFLENFCKKHGFDYAEIMKDFFFSKNFRTSSFFDANTIFNLDNIINVILSKANEDKFWQVNPEFLTPVGNNHKEKNAVKLMEVWIECIGSKRIDLAIALMRTYHYELTEQIKEVLEHQKENEKNIIYYLNRENINEVGKTSVSEILKNEDPIDIYSESTLNKIILSLTEGSYQRFHQWIDKNHQVMAHHNANIIKNYMNELNNFKMVINKINEKDFLEKKLEKKDTTKKVSKI